MLTELQLTIIKSVATLENERGTITDILNKIDYYGFLNNNKDIIELAVVDLINREYIIESWDDVLRLSATGRSAYVSRIVDKK